VKRRGDEGPKDRPKEGVNPSQVCLRAFFPGVLIFSKGGLKGTLIHPQFDPRRRVSAPRVPSLIEALKASIACQPQQSLLRQFRLRAAAIQAVLHPMNRLDCLEAAVHCHGEDAVNVEVGNEKPPVPPSRALSK